MELKPPQAYLAATVFPGVGRNGGGDPTELAVYLWLFSCVVNSSALWKTACGEFLCQQYFLLETGMFL